MIKLDRINSSTLGTAVFCTIAGFCLSGTARGQSIDYGQLEQLFGEPVTAAATGSPLKATDVPANMEIISADDIHHTGAVNIPDVLRNVAGIDVRSYGKGDQDVVVRGYNQSQSPRLLVLVNGRQVYIDDFGYTDWDAIPVQLDEIRQIEVVRGPNSALFGFNAVGGVINIVTFDPLNDSTNVVTARAGTDAYAGGSAVGTFHWGNWLGIRASVGGYRAEDPQPTGALANEVLAYGSSYNLNPYSRSGSLDARIQVSPSVQANLEGTTSMSEHMLGGIGAALSSTIVRNSSLKAGVSGDSPVGLINVDAYRNDLHFNNGATIYLTNIVTVAQASDLFKIGNDNTVRIGGEYRDNGITSASWNGNAGYRVMAGDAMWSWQIQPDLALTNSVRLDHLELYRGSPVVSVSPYSQAQYDNGSTNQVSFNSGLVYKLDDIQTIRLLAARGIQAPSLLDYNFNVAIQLRPGLRGVYAGTPDVKPTAVSNLEIDYDRSIPSFHSLLRTAAYYQTNRDLLQPGLSLPFRPYLFVPSVVLESNAQNIGSSNAVGGEISLKGNDNGWRWQLSYSLEQVYQNVRYSYSVATPVTIDYRNASPDDVIFGGLGYSIDKWEFDGNLRWQSGFTDFIKVKPNTVSPLAVKSYFTSNLRAGYQVFEQVQAAVTVQQLQQQTTETAAGLPMDRRAIFSISSKF